MRLFAPWIAITAMALSACGGDDAAPAGRVSVTETATAATEPVSTAAAPVGQLSVPTYPQLSRLNEVERLKVSPKYRVEVRRISDTVRTVSTVFETSNDWILYDFFNKDPARKGDILRSATQYGSGKSDLRTASFTRFSFANEPVMVIVRLLDPDDTITTATVRPLRHQITPNISADRRTLAFRLDQPAKVSVEINDRLNPLFILSDAPETPDTTATHYFAPGVHRIPGASGTLTLNSGQSVYIAAGAIVEGRFVVARGAQNVSIRGRGILSRGEWNHTSADYDFLKANATVWSDYTSNLTVAGLTIVNSNAWQIAIEDYSGTGSATRNNRYVDLNLITWNGNTDAFWVSGNNNVVDNAFVFNNDDVIVSKGGTGTKASNIVTWGSVWGRMFLMQPILDGFPNISDLTIENLDMIGKEGSPTLITFGSNTRGKSVDGVTLRNIRVEERRRAGNTNNTGYNAVRFVTLEDSYQLGSISNLVFDNVRLDQALADEGFVRGSDKRRFANYTFRNFYRGGTKVLNKAGSGIQFNEYVDNVKFE